MLLAGCILFGLVDGAPPTPVQPPFWTAGAATYPAGAADARLPDSVSLLATMRRPRRTQYDAGQLLAAAALPAVRGHSDQSRPSSSSFPAKREQPEGEARRNAVTRGRAVRLPRHLSDGDEARSERERRGAADGPFRLRLVPEGQERERRRGGVRHQDGPLSSAPAGHGDRVRGALSSR